MLPLDHCKHKLNTMINLERTNKEYSIPEAEKAILESTIAYLEKSQQERNNKVELLTQALGETIDKTQLFTLVVSRTNDCCCYSRP